jgi:hypothetical protein
MHATITKLAVNWLTVIPFTIHSFLFKSLLRQAGEALIERCSSYGVIANYNTTARANVFLEKISVG